ncbi:F-box domain-containing protein [Mycena kentingensis (nom. inval.)]|nr:F-box domain-containing protein [Mycena kentingensis (nom. inval.)]
MRKTRLPKHPDGPNSGAYLFKRLSRNESPSAPFLRTTTYTMLVDLPVELILNILDGATVADILHATRTSRYLRFISLAHRSLWNHACDPHKLVLPFGDTLQSANLALILCSAARAASIARRLLSATAANPIYPLHTRELRSLYDLAPYRPWSPERFARPTFLGHAPPPILAVLPGGRAFILGDTEHLAVYDVAGEWALELAAPAYSRFYSFGTSVADVRRRVSWNIEDSGKRSVVAFVSSGIGTTQRMERHLSVFALESAEGTGQMYLRHADHFLLSMNADSVGFQGHNVVVVSGACSEAQFELGNDYVAEGTRTDAAERNRTWVEDCDISNLALPDDIPVQGRVLKMDEVTGVALAFCRGQLWTLQY